MMKPVIDSPSFWKRWIRRVWATIHPSSLNQFDYNLRTRRASQVHAQKARAYRIETANLSLEKLVDIAIQKGHPFRATQKRTEILSLLEQVRERRPRYICEIGSDKGGTLALFSRVARPDAEILSLDIAHTPQRLAAFKQLVQPGQKLTCITGDTHTQAILNQFKAWLGNNQLDFLFIDGDHTYEGVKLDYEMYSPFVRQGGLIAFHDVTPADAEQYAPDSPYYTAGVAQFWEKHQAELPNPETFIEDPNQQGYGIGILHP